MLEHSQLDNLHRSLNASAISRQQNISEHNPVPERKEQAVHNDQVDLNKIETEIKKVVSQAFGGNLFQQFGFQFRGAP